MTDAVIVSSARTANGTAFNGSLVDVDAYEPSTLAVAEAVRRRGIDPILVEMCAGGGMSTALVLDVPPPAAPPPMV